MLFSQRQRIVKEFQEWARNANKQIKGGKVDEKDLGTFLAFLEIKDYINEKEVPKEVTHEATLYRCLTCPSCKNVVSKHEDWDGKKVVILHEYCPFCGQHLKGEDEE